MTGLLIPLSRGLQAVVDAADFEVVISAGAWHATPGKHTFYARRNSLASGKWTTTRMHNLITGWAYVDHINGNGLDNRRNNLRPADRSRNGANRNKQDNNTSGFKGVTWHAPTSQWKAQIATGRKSFHLGLFATRESAARAYDLTAIQMFGEYARTNFPKENL